VKIKCDKPMARHKMRDRRGLEGWTCNKDCQRCICGMVKMNDGTYEHIKLGKNGEMWPSQRRGESND